MQSNFAELKKCTTKKSAHLIRKVLAKSSAMNISDG